MNSSAPRIPLLAVAALAMLGLAGCAGASSPPAAEETVEESPGETTPPEEPEEPEASEEPAEGAEGDAVLMIGSTDLGEIVVDADGRTVYMFDSDTQGSGESTCTGSCLTMWPPVIATSATPTGTDITGELGTIETPEGELQVTLNGWPVYLYAGDSAPGDVNGQGVGGIWWVLDPAGERTESMPDASDLGY